MWKRLSLVLTAALLAACGGSSGQQSDPDAGRSDRTRPDTSGPTTEITQPADSQEKLAGTSWRLVSLDGREPIEGTRITLLFREEGLRGNAGCNSYGAQANVGHGRIRVSTISRTEMVCGKGGGIMKQEDEYIRALGNAAAYRIRDGRLEISDATGETTLILEKETR